MKPRIGITVGADVIAEYERAVREAGGEPVPLAPVISTEAVLGAKVTVPTLTGPVTLTVPRHSDHGKRLRLRGRGVPAHAGHADGDLYVTLHLVVGKPDAALEQALGDWAARNPDDPRAHLKVVP